MICTLAVIRTELMEHADGRPVAYIDATGMVVFTYQEPDGTYIIDIFTRNDSGERVSVLLDGLSLNRTRMGTATGACLHYLRARGDPQLAGERTGHMHWRRLIARARACTAAGKRRWVL